MLGFTHLYSLPVELYSSTVSSWLTVQDVHLLDVANTNRAHRPIFLLAVKNACVQDSEAYPTDTNVLKLIQWIRSREIILQYGTHSALKCSAEKHQVEVTAVADDLIMKEDIVSVSLGCWLFLQLCLDGVSRASIPSNIARRLIDLTSHNSVQIRKAAIFIGKLCPIIASCPLFCSLILCPFPGFYLLLPENHSWELCRGR